MKELIPKMKEGKGFYGDDKYNFVAKDKNPQRERGY